MIKAKNLPVFQYSNLKGSSGGCTMSNCSDQGEYFLHVKVDWIIGSAGD